MQHNGFLSRLIVIGTVCGLSTTAWAVPYASSVRDVGPAGGNWEFVLNEAAENVTVLRNGGNALDLGALTPGRHTFDMAGFSSWEIKVTQNTPVAPWTEISSPSNLFTNFEQGNALAVNTDPSSQYFGIVYVINPRTNATVSGRSMGEGVYAMTADLLGVDFATSEWLVPDPNDTSQAKAPGWTADATQPLNPWRMTLDEGGNLIVSDWTDLYGGIKYASPDLSTGGLVLATEEGPTGGVIGQNGLPVHGSIVSQPNVTGTVGVDLTVWAMDEDLDKDRTLPPPGGTDTGHGNSVWRWDVGSQTNYNIEPELAVNVANIRKTVDNRANFISINTGVLANALYSPETNKFYLTQDRDDGNQAGLIVVTPGGENGSAPVLEWSSLEFSIANNLDGHDTLNSGGTGCTAGATTCVIQDFLRDLGGGLTLSPDGTQLFVHRTATRDTNPYFGTDSTDPTKRGAVIIIPLDANGVPTITPDLSNVTTITTEGNDATASRREVVLDAAGNVYITNNNSELLQVFSPGGATMASTRSDGTFTVMSITDGLPGDFNGDGSVDAADYVVWRKTDGSPEGYNDWRMNFGRTSGSGAGQVAAVPEPGALLLAAIGLLGLAIRRAGACTRRALT